jgi:hypothetical protein
MAKKKKKSKEQLLAEIAFASGRNSMFESDNAAEVVLGAEIAVAKWKEQTGGRKPKPREIDRARQQWIADGRPKEGTLYPRPLGYWYVFSSNDDWLLKESLEKNANLH